MTDAEVEAARKSREVEREAARIAEERALELAREAREKDRLKKELEAAARRHDEDLGRAERGSLGAAMSPCYLNNQYPTDVVIGGGRNLSAWLRETMASKGLPLANCLAPPEQAYVFPRDLYRY